MRMQINALAHQSSVSHWKHEKLLHTTRIYSKRETSSGFNHLLCKKKFRVMLINLNNTSWKGLEE